MPTKTITFRIPGPEEVLASLGLSRRQIEQGLKLIQEKYGPPDKLTPGEYTIELPEEVVIYDFTNQAVIPPSTNWLKKRERMAGPSLSGPG